MAKRKRKFETAPFDASAYLTNEETIAEYLAAAIEDPNPSLRWENQQAAPRVLEDQTAANPTRKPFDYSPVRLASYTEDSQVASATTEVHGSLNIAPGNIAPADAEASRPASGNPNSRWQTARW